jgi:hypothetical protein
MKPLSFSLIGIVALALFTSAADAQIQPWNTIILVNRFPGRLPHVMLTKKPPRLAGVMACHIVQKGG